MNMKLYQKLKDRDLVEDMKDFRELIWLRAITVNGKHVVTIDHEITDTDKNIRVGILNLE